MAAILKYPVNGEMVDICARYQHEFDNCSDFREIKKLVLSIESNDAHVWDNTTPVPVKFMWESDSVKAVLEISEDASFEESEKYSVQGNNMSVYNLKKDTRYFWRVNGCSAEQFVTDGVMPRWIAAEGIGNVRDIGGRRNSDGVRIKQGLIFRGFKLENSVTDKGREQLKQLGIKTELDLRKESAGVVRHSFIDESVDYIQIACSGYEEFVRNDIDDGTCKKLIEFMADSDNYPIYFHCLGGQDRTGTLAFLLDAILGLDDETMLREYELTMLSSPEQKISRSRKKNFRPFLKCIRKNGRRKNSLRENTMLFLKKANVADATIRQLRDNLLEKQ